MYEAILLITGLVILFLGVRLVMKFREMARWKDEDAVVGGTGNSALPPELRELKIDEPSDDDINRLDVREEKSTPGTDMTPKQP
jgi:hypothetical protein